MPSIWRCHGLPRHCEICGGLKYCRRAATLKTARLSIFKSPSEWALRSSRIECSGGLIENNPVPNPFSDRGKKNLQISYHVAGGPRRVNNKQQRLSVVHGMSNH